MPEGPEVWGMSYALQKLGLYQIEIDKLKTSEELINFINKWCYYNLYKIRIMKVYKNPVAKQIKCCGRIFYQLYNNKLLINNKI